MQVTLLCLAAEPGVVVLEANDSLPSLVVAYTICWPSTVSLGVRDNKDTLGNGKHAKS